MTNEDALLSVSASEAALVEWRPAVTLGLLGCTSVGNDLTLAAVVSSELTLEGESFSDRFSLFLEDSMAEERLGVLESTEGAEPAGDVLLQSAPERMSVPASEPSAETLLEGWKSRVLVLQPLEVESVTADLSLDQSVLAEWKSMGDKEFTGCKSTGEDLRSENISFGPSRPGSSFEE